MVKESSIYKKMDVTCPKTGCGHEFEIDVPVNTPNDPNHLSRQDIQAEIARSNQEKARDEELALSKAEAAAYRTGQKLPSTESMLAHITSCPECTAKAVSALKPQVIGSLTPEEAKTIAKTHKLYPPPPIDIIGVPSSRGMRR